MAEAMGEYDAIEDASTGVTSATRTATDKGRYYTLSGALANASSRGIIIGNGKKTIR
jgi:hypothetical protein